MRATIVAMVGVALAVPTPPSQSAYQAFVVQQIRARAKIASQKSTQKLLALLDSPDFRNEFLAIAPQLSGLTSTALLTNYRDAVSTAEIIHNFPADASLQAFNNVDVDLKMLMGRGPDAYNATYFINQWEIAILSPNHTDRDTLMEWMVPAAAAEMGLYRMRGFSGINPFGISGLGGWPANYEEASERVVYTSFNLFRTDIGVGEFGPVGVVFDRHGSAGVQNMTVLSAVDTVICCFAESPFPSYFGFLALAGRF